jgi:hypothetical protein
MMGFMSMPRPERPPGQQLLIDVLDRVADVMAQHYVRGVNIC